MKSLKRINKSLFYMLFLFLLIACNSKKNFEKGEEARSLFSKSAELIEKYTSLFKNTQDSLQLDSLVELFEKQITDINFAVPPETDYKLTEMENDSLYRLLDKLKKIRTEKYQDFSVQSYDTISDSVLISHQVYE